MQLADEQLLLVQWKRQVSSCTKLNWKSNFFFLNHKCNFRTQKQATLPIKQWVGKECWMTITALVSNLFLFPIHFFFNPKSEMKHQKKKSQGPSVKRLGMKTAKENKKYQNTSLKEAAYWVITKLTWWVNFNIVCQWKTKSSSLEIFKDSDNENNNECMRDKLHHWPWCWLHQSQAQRWCGPHSRSLWRWSCPLCWWCPRSEPPSPYSNAGPSGCLQFLLGTQWQGSWIEERSLNNWSFFIHEAIFIPMLQGHNDDTKVNFIPFKSTLHRLPHLTGW